MTESDSYEVIKACINPKIIKIWEDCIKGAIPNMNVKEVKAFNMKTKDENYSSAKLVFENMEISIYSDSEPEVMFFKRGHLPFVKSFESKKQLRNLIEDNEKGKFW